MSETTEQNPAGEVQPPAEEKSDADRIALLEAKNRQLLSEKQSWQQKAKDYAAQQEQLQQREQSRKQADLLASGQADVLVAQLRETVAEKDKRIQELTVALSCSQTEQARLRSNLDEVSALAAVRAGLEPLADDGREGELADPRDRPEGTFRSLEPVWSR